MCGRGRGEGGRGQAGLGDGVTTGWDMYGYVWLWI